MREIKFRCFNTKSKEMLYDVGIIPNKKDVSVSIGSDGIFINPSIDSGRVLMQFTGLKDKNGKDIYEGDFIQNVTDDGRRLSIFEITWQQSCCGFVKEREDGHTFTLEISKYFEVIGNKFETPDLINSDTTTQQEKKQL